jgi:hypothetical protein
MQQRRRYERVAFYCPVHLTALPNGPAVPGWTFDISVGGVGLVAETWLECWQTVSVRFHLNCGSSEGVDEDVLGRVAYCQAEDECNRIGIEFSDTVRESTHPVLTRKIDNL